ncbi:MAG: type II toxin-antitoxin system VapC family toxin [Betaproteobacteria bacterium]|nr:type II toxin-antitoxin system VapC family toxin [Betaproteobacteria bacterium]
MRCLLDTHILIWWSEDLPHLSARQKAALDQAAPNQPLLVADVSLWEIATLYGLGRIVLNLPLREWLDRAVAAPLVRVCPITPAVAATVAALPDSFHRDPADRLIVSTALVEGARLITADANIIRSGVVSTL